MINSKAFGFTGNYLKTLWKIIIHIFEEIIIIILFFCFWWVTTSPPLHYLIARKEAKQILKLPLFVIVLAVTERPVTLSPKPKQSHLSSALLLQAHRVSQLWIPCMFATTLMLEWEEVEEDKQRNHKHPASKSVSYVKFGGRRGKLHLKIQLASVL